MASCSVTGVTTAGQVATISWTSEDGLSDATGLVQQLIADEAWVKATVTGPFFPAEAGPDAPPHVALWTVLLAFEGRPGTVKFDFPIPNFPVPDGAVS